MKILGIDPGITTGLALLSFDDEGWQLDRRWELRPETETRGEALSSLYGELYQVCFEDQQEPVVSGIAMEAFLAYGTNTAEEKIEAQAVIKLFAYDCKVPLHTYAPVTVRSAVIGSGRATPAQIKATMRHLLGLGKTSKRGEAFTDHQCDAVAVTLCHLVCSGELQILRPQRRAA